MITIFLWSLGLLAALSTVVLILGTRARVRLQKRYPPIGRMIDIGGYRLHMYMEGEGSPTVVLDAGAGGIGLGWELVRPAIARVTRVVVYDRAGLGWSEPGPHPRDANRMAEELHRLLHNGNIPGPYLLAGHSLGGSIARQFAALYPDETAGLVMVDSAHEHQVKFFPERLVKTMMSMMGILKIIDRLHRAGLFALNPTWVSLGDQGRLPAATQEMARAVMASSNSHIATLIAESQSVYSPRTPPVQTLGDLPLTVLSHGHLDDNAVPPSLGPEIREEYERAWQDLQQEITSLSTRGRRIVAGRSGHNIPFEQPEIIIKAILEMITTVREMQDLPRKEVTVFE